MQMVLSFCFRLGKKSQLMARPMKIIFETELLSTQVLKAFTRQRKEIQERTLIPNLIIFPDRTPMRQRQFKEARLEIIKRSSEGEKNLRLIYKDNILTIVSTLKQNVNKT